MKIGAMLSDISHSLFKKPVTQQYPYIRLEAPERYRGKLIFDPMKCTGCQLCVKDCPSLAIDLITVDKVNRHYAIRYHADRCTFCGQCVVNCRPKCLSLSSTQWELASTTKEPFTVLYGRDEDIAALMATASHENSGNPEIC